MNVLKKKMSVGHSKMYLNAKRISRNIKNSVFILIVKKSKSMYRDSINENAFNVILSFSFKYSAKCKLAFLFVIDRIL